jgi:RNA recognition motif-containing protein
MKLWMGNMAPNTTDEEIKDLVKKYAPDLTCTSIERVEGTGSRPGAMLELAGGGMGAIENLSRRLNGIYWKQRELVCQKLGL